MEKAQPTSQPAAPAGTDVKDAAAVSPAAASPAAASPSTASPTTTGPAPGISRTASTASHFHTSPGGTAVEQKPEKS